MVAEVDENRQFQVSDELDTLTDALARWKQYQDTYSYRKNARYPDYNRLSYMLIETMFTVDWLKTLGATFEPKTPISDRGMAMLQVNVPEIPLTSGAAQLLAHLENLVTNNSNATLLVETAAYELIMDGNKAIGVKAKAPNGEIEVYGKSVILACGSYTQNQAMMEQYIPDIGEVDVWAVVSDTGDGIKMALEAGAALWEEDFIHPAPPNISNAFKAINPSRNNVPSFYNTLLVDKNGNRIMNEADSSYARQVLKMAELKTGPYWALHEDQDLTSAQREMLETGLSTTGVVKGETLAIVAEKAGISIGGFQTTFDQYNEFAATGNDTEFGKPAANLRPYGLEGPYYMVRMIPCACDVLGGIVTDQEYKILNDQGKPFDSLWAAGSMSNGQYYNQYYFSGSSLTFASTSGRLTGKQAADNAKK
jgi:succinate dehydrogenase/fumarate reductase flavoprotein subunit